MGLFSLVTKPLRALDKVADVTEEAIDTVTEHVVDYVTGDWDGEERKRREARRGDPR